MCMDKTWVKLYRKILDKGWLRNKRDHNKFLVFCWLLMFVDYKTGKCTLGRYFCKEVGFNPSTFYSTLTQLQSRGAINIKSNNKFSEVQIVKWEHYQGLKVEDNNKNNNKITTNQQQNNTNQEYKNKELRNNTANFSKKENLILSDPTFQRYVKIYRDPTDEAVRAKMVILPTLERRYPFFQFQKEWSEVKQELQLNSN